MEKFLLVSNFARSVVNFRLDLLKHILSLGHQVAIACPISSDDSNYLGKVRELGIAVYDIPFSRTGLNPMADLKSYSISLSVLKQYNPTCVLAYTVKPISYFIPASHKHNVVRRYSMLAGLGYAFGDNKKGLRSRLVSSVVKKLYSNSLKKSSGVIFQNNDDAKTLINENVYFDMDKSHVVAGSGVNLDHFEKKPLPSQLTFLIATRLLKEKGISQYLEAASILKKKYPDCRFLVAGGLDNNPSSITQKELNEWIDSGFIEYLGRLSDVRVALDQSSVFVLPSYYREGTPRSILEAMAVGRAIITTDSPGCRETVIDGWNGYLVRPRDTDSLVIAMERFILNKNTLIKCADNSYKQALKKYDVNKVNKMMCEIMGLG